jgi:DNA gyrase subunit A
MLISTGGVLIRTAVAQIREQGRSTQGVTLIALSEGEKLAGIERIVDRDEEGNGGNGSGEVEPPVAPADPAGQGPTIH